jgi:uncharacterized membrane-anchored protein
LRPLGDIHSIDYMLLEVSRLLFGLILLAFHRQIAEFMLAQERVLVVLFRQRGLRLPDLDTRTAYNIYFGVGLFVCILQLFRIWLLLPH